jgi:branched-subunit amino acid transport protein AzlD
MDNKYILYSIIVMGFVTFITRSLPFVFFKKIKPNDKIQYLGKFLPPAVMAMLIIYSLKGTVVISYPYGIPELTAIISVVIIHKLKGNTLLSILGATFIYMILVQIVFV